MNKQVDRIVAAYKYQKHQDMADSIDRERIIDELSAYRLENNQTEHTEESTTSKTPILRSFDYSIIPTTILNIGLIILGCVFFNMPGR